MSKAPHKVQGERLRALRERLGWSLEKFADAISCRSTYVGSAEAGRVKISGRLAKLVRYVARDEGIELDQDLSMLERADR